VKRVAHIEMIGEPGRRFNKTLHGLNGLPLAFIRCSEQLMMKIHFTSAAGKEAVLAVPVGTRIMHAAVDCRFDGIVAECDGSCMCATCHVYVRAEQIDRLPPILPAEDAMLDSTASERHSNSRLSCQPEVSPAMDGLRFTLPETQI
jgi:2Fe-2S ferredoxin